jgi:hypothetical protein
MRPRAAQRQPLNGLRLVLRKNHKRDPKTARMLTDQASRNNLCLQVLLSPLSPTTATAGQPCVLRRTHLRQSLVRAARVLVQVRDDRPIVA